MHDCSRHLYGHRAGIGMAVAALSRTTEARARVPQRNSSNSDRLSVVADCSGFCCRFVVAKAGKAISLVQGHLRWTRISAQLSRRSMALRQFPYVSGVTKLDLRD